MQYRYLMLAKCHRDALHHQIGKRVEDWMMMLAVQNTIYCMLKSTRCLRKLH